MTPEARARKIVALGGQILLPYEAGDAMVQFQSRRALVEIIALAIDKAVQESYEQLLIERGLGLVE